MKELWQPQHTVRRESPHGTFEMTVGDSTIPGKDAPLKTKLVWVLGCRRGGFGSKPEDLYKKISDFIGTGDMPSKEDSVRRIRRILPRIATEGTNGNWRLKDAE